MREEKQQATSGKAARGDDGLGWDEVTEDPQGFAYGMQENTGQHKNELYSSMELSGIALGDDTGRALWH